MFDCSFCWVLAMIMRWQSSPTPSWLIKVNITYTSLYSTCYCCYIFIRRITFSSWVGSYFWFGETLYPHNEQYPWVLEYLFNDHFPSLKSFGRWWSGILLTLQEPFCPAPFSFLLPLFMHFFIVSIFILILHRNVCCCSLMKTIYGWNVSFNH